MQDSRLRIREATVGFIFFLAHDLEGVGDTAGHNAGIESSAPGTTE